MLYRRKSLPTRVTLGSLRILNKTPPTLSLRSATSASRRSASTTMVRNLIIRNGTLSWPMRSAR